MEQADKDRRDQVFRQGGNAGALTQVSERSLAAVSAPISLGLLDKIYQDDGQEVYDHASLSALYGELQRFGDLPSVAEVYSPPRVAAQAMTVGMRPGFSIDLGTLKPDGTPWDLEDDADFRLSGLGEKRKSRSCCTAVRRATHSQR